MVKTLDRVTEFAARKIRVPDNVQAITAIGEETAITGIDAVWDRVVDFYKTGMHPAVQICIRYRDEVVLDRAIGYAHGLVPGRDPGKEAVILKTDTPMNLFSAAKAVTSIVMHKLEADGILDLDETVANYLPGFERHGKGAITLRQVLNHRAGIPTLPAEALDLELLGNVETIDEFVLDLKPTQKQDGPPAYHAVSGGFIMDAVVRQLTGKNLREVLETDFKKPLGLRWFDYGVSPEDAGLVAQNVMTGLRLGPLLSRVMHRLLGMPWDQVVELSNDPRFISGIIPSANVIATARDVASFYQCLLNGGEFNGKKILSADTVEKLVHDKETKIEFDRMIGVPMRYGNGFMMGSQTISLYGWNHPRAFGHVGMSNSFTWADPDRDLVVALLTTGKPIIGTHLLALPSLISEIHRTFPLNEEA